jgi:hypothetical protein
MGFDVDKYTRNPFLKGDDLEEGERLPVTIKTAEEVTFPSGDVVPVISFMEIDQKLTLNKTRVKKLAEMFGTDTDAWIGQKIALYPVDVTFQGKATLGVAITGVARKAGVKARPASDDVKFMDAAEEDNPF